jgi:hypothetical protein
MVVPICEPKRSTGHAHRKCAQRLVNCDRAVGYVTRATFVKRERSFIY